MDIQNADIHDNEIVTEPAETNADNLSARVTIEVHGHKSDDGRTSADIEREQEEARQAAEDDKETE